jgi:hypothetical protein
LIHKNPRTFRLHLELNRPIVDPVNFHRTRACVSRIPTPVGICRTPEVISRVHSIESPPETVAPPSKTCPSPWAGKRCCCQSAQENKERRDHYQYLRSHTRTPFVFDLQYIRMPDNRKSFTPFAPSAGKGLLDPARIPHRLSAAALDPGMSSALHSVGLLNILPSIPAGSSVTRLISAPVCTAS